MTKNKSIYSTIYLKTLIWQIIGYSAIDQLLLFSYFGQYTDTSDWVSRMD